MATTALFDQYGRCVPAQLKAKANEKSRRYFSVVQPKLDYDKIYQRFDNVFSIASQISIAEFKIRAEKVLASLADENIGQGVAVPFILPKAEYADIGAALEDIYLPGVQQSFNSSFPDYSFVNHSAASLKGQFNVAADSRHQQLIDAMKEGVVVGFFFPCLLEYSVPAAIEQLANLPENFLLAGGFDTAAAFIGSPDLLLREKGYPPLLWLSGLSADSEGAGYHFEAYGYDLTFNRRMHLEQVAEYWASAVVVLG